uniref:ThiF domain-containing protein n=1 Tax=Heterorhabditis bacteriophora TaxID=37862 RepID=A0A1I7XNY6_HETBA
MGWREKEIAKLSNKRVLVVGAGGIGCELLKNIVLTGFQRIHVIDLDTIDVSNLNRQFLFRREHVGKSKAEVATEAVKNLLPNVDITFDHASIFSEKFNLPFFEQFTLVMNALDNRAARNHVNRMCLAGRIPLIESGSSGYLGQVSVILRDRTECYECVAKPVQQKTFPGCTIRNTPSEHIHCTVWAKHLFKKKIWKNRVQVPMRHFPISMMLIRWLFLLFSRVVLILYVCFFIDYIVAMAGNIIPAIATTNAMVAGMMVIEALKVISGDMSKLRTVFITRNPNPRGKILVEQIPDKPHPKCFVCSEKRECCVRINPEEMTVKGFQDKVVTIIIIVIYEVLRDTDEQHTDVDEEVAESRKRKSVAAAEVLDTEKWLQEIIIRAMQESMQAKEQYSGSNVTEDNDDVVGCLPGLLLAAHRQEVESIVDDIPGAVVDGNLRKLENNLDRYSRLLNIYQEQPSLLDSIVPSLLNKLLTYITLPGSGSAEIHLNELSIVSMSYLSHLTKVRGYKIVVRLLPHHVGLVSRRNAPMWHSIFFKYAAALVISQCLARSDGIPLLADVLMNCAKNIALDSRSTASALSCTVSS